MTVSQPKNIVTVIPVVETLQADMLTPLAVYLKLSANSQNSFLLESVEGGTSLARYSFIGADPYKITIGGKDEFENLRTHFCEYIATPDAELPSFIGGAIGYLSFECCEWLEPSLKTNSDAGECGFMFFRSIVAFDHARQLVKIISLAIGDGTSSQRNTLIEEAKVRNAEIRKNLENDSIVLPTNLVKEKCEAVSNWKRDDFESAVGSIKDLINAGECYQAVLSQCFTRRTDATPIAIYRALRSLNPSPYMFLLQFEHKAIVGASPEMLVRCKGDKLEYRPIAGTRPRGRTSEEDESLAEEMCNDKKEIAEHMMLVDLGRNDLGRIAEFGSVKVETLMAVEKYSHVQHLVSSLTAKLATGKDRFDALAACFPAGTVSGAPKVRAIETIRDIEPTSRGVYAGAVGYFDYTGNMDTCIAIRTLVLENGVAKIQAGAGIVADSVPVNEFDETVNKAKVLMRAVDIAESGEF
ncbi:MAG: anthranilate synthase component I family protein [Pyrinomonadaceae bacterium]